MVTEQDLQPTQDPDKPVIDAANLAARVQYTGIIHWDEVFETEERNLGQYRRRGSGFVVVGDVNMDHINSFKGRLSEHRRNLRLGAERQVELFHVGRTIFRKRAMRIDGLAIALISPQLAFTAEDLLQGMSHHLYGNIFIQDFYREIAFLNYYFDLGLNPQYVDGYLSLVVPERVTVGPINTIIPRRRIS